MQHNALLLEGIHESSIPVLHDAGFSVDRRKGSMDTDELRSSLQGVDVLGIRSNTTVSAEVLDAAPDLLAIGCFCIGTNQVDLAAAAERGIAVFNAPYSNSRSVVELVIGEIISLARRLGEKTQKMHAGVWDKSAAGSHEVRGQTLGIVGYGNIGTQLSNVAEALGMSVVFYDINDRPAHGNARRLSSLEELLESSDIVTLHVDGRPGNAGLFGEAQFSRMRPGSVFINASRGMVVDDVALRDHIVSGHLSGAALDVFPIEPKAQGDPFDSVLRGLDNVILTPHVGASTLQAQEEIGRFVGGKLTSFVTAGSTSLSVNLPQVSLPPHTYAERIGCLHENERGVLSQITSLLAETTNISAQYLATEGDLGYVVSDCDSTVPQETVQALGALPHTQWVRTW